MEQCVPDTGCVITGVILAFIGAGTVIFAAVKIALYLISLI